MSNELNNLYEFGEFRFDGGRHKLWRNDELILLSPKATELLELLLERKGKFVSKEEIFERVWADTFVEDGVLTQNIYLLRRALGNGEDALPVIENKTRLGYRITIPIRFVESSNGKEISLAAQTRAEIIAEEIIEKDQPKLPTAKSARGWKRNGVIFAASLILLSIVGFFGYLFLRPPPETVVRKVIENLRFQKVTDTGDIFFSTISPDGSLAAYAKLDGVYVKDLRTSAESKLKIGNVEKFGFLEFSDDGNFLYLRNRASLFLPSKILKVSRFGGEAIAVAENVWSAFSLSPDERQIAFVRRFPNENRQSLFLKNLTTGAENELTTVNLPQEFNLRAFPAWSPDGKKLLLTVRQQNEEFLKLMIVEATSGQTEDLSIENLQNVEQVVWLPKRNAFAATARMGRNYQLWEIDYAGKQVGRITNDLIDYRSLSISADGTKILNSQLIYFSNLWVIDEENGSNQKQLTFGTSNQVGYHGIDYFSNGEIVYTSNEGESSDINLWRINPNDNERRQLTANAGSQNKNPCLSPDNKFVYFSSNRGGKAHIWRIEVNGENPTQMTFSENSAETFPQISPEGDWLYFIRNDRQSSAVWRKSLTVDKEERITDEKRLVPSSSLSLSPDGKHLAFQNLTREINSENINQNFQIAIVETANPEDVKFFTISGGKVEIYWTNDSTAFDYIDAAKDKVEIRRLNLDEKVGEKILREFPKERIFTIARSKDGKTIAVSRGQLEYNAVLLTNFE